MSYGGSREFGAPNGRLPATALQLKGAEVPLGTTSSATAVEEDGMTSRDCFSLGT